MGHCELFVLDRPSVRPGHFVYISARCSHLAGGVIGNGDPLHKAIIIVIHWNFKGSSTS